MSRLHSVQPAMVDWPGMVADSVLIRKGIMMLGYVRSIGVVTLLDEHECGMTRVIDKAGNTTWVADRLIYDSEQEADQAEAAQGNE